MAAFTPRASAPAGGEGTGLDPVVRSALLESERLAAERKLREAENPRPAVTRVECELSDRFHAEVKAAKRRRGVGGATGHGPWIQEIEPMPADRAEAALRALSAGASFLHFAARAKGTNVERDRHLRDYLIFCRLLRVNPYLYEAQHTSTLHAYIAWKALSYRKDRQKQGSPLGLQFQTVANEVSTVRTFHAEVVGVNLLKIDPLSKQLLKGVKRVSGAEKPRLRISQQMMLEMEILDEQSGSLRDRAQARARRWCFAPMLRISEIADTATARHYLLHVNVTFKVVGGIARDCAWCFTGKNHQFQEIARSVVAEPESPRDFVTMMYEVSLENEEFLQKNPKFKRESLPFIHVNGKPLTKSSVTSHLRKRLGQTSSMTQERLRRFKTGTHCMRRGGARMWLNLGVGETYLRWLGGWKSLAWLVYPEVAGGLRRRAAHLRAMHMQQAIASRFR